LGEIHSHDLERLTDKLVQSQIGQLQFANAVVSLSMGFFTHAGSQPPDQRYLEVMVGLPDILDDHPDANTHINQLFSQYGRELLTVLSSERAIVDDAKIAGYGLNFSWRSMAVTPSGPRMTLNETVLYLGKEQAEKFLHGQLDQDGVLRDSTLFLRKGEQPAKHVAYVPPSPQPQVQVFTGLAAPVRLQPQDELPLTESPLMTALRKPTVAESNTQSKQALQENPFQTLESRLAPAAAKKTEEKKPDGEEPLFTAPQEQAPGTASAPVALEAHAATSRSEYLAQLWYAKEEEAQRWINLLSSSGYATSLEKVPGSLPARIRVGRFASLVDATRFLEHFKTYGTQGQILQVER
jgi:hypothetical protein